MSNGVLCTPIRILIADDHPMVRQGLSQICDAEPDMQVVGQASNGQDAYRLAVLLHPDVIVMDMIMPGLDGVQVTQHLTVDNPDVGVIILTVCNQDHYILDAIKAGARAYLLKDADSDTLLRTIRAVAAKETVVNPHMARTILDEFRHQQSDPVVSNGITYLTEGDLHILRLMAQGMDMRAVGEQLNMTEQVVRQRLTRMAEKLHISEHA